MRSVLQCPGDCPDFRGGQCVYDTDHHHGFELGVRQTHRSCLPLQALEYLQQDLRTYLSFAVVLLVGITGRHLRIFVPALEQTLSQVEGYEREIASLQRQQGEYDRLVSAPNLRAKGSALREEKQLEERKRLESYISERREDIKDAETSKANYATQTDQMIVGERGRREAEQKDSSPSFRYRQDIGALEIQKREYKEEADARIQQELAKEAKVNERLAQIDVEEQAKEAKVNERLAELDAAVKVYRDKGRTFLEDGIKRQTSFSKSGRRKGGFALDPCLNW